MFQEDSLHAVFRNQNETDQLVVLCITLLDVFEDEANVCLCHRIPLIYKRECFCYISWFYQWLGCNLGLMDSQKLSSLK